MPHLVLEFSDNLPSPDPGPFFRALHAALAEVAPCRVEDLKSRIYRCEAYLAADGEARQGFAHLSIRLFEGRDEARLKAIGEVALRHLGQAFPQGCRPFPFDLTAEIVPMRRDSYFKVSHLPEA
jgi:5-carboxymethyl-2-hydroxymuconate isomerase